MCLIHFQLNNHPTYKLVVAANRDEEYMRPTEKAHFWPDAPNLLAGRDLRQKGTWLGITKDGRFATLTNIRDMSLETGDKKSRGHIVKDFLVSKDDPVDFLKKVRQERHEYAGFNIITGNLEQLFHYNNVENKITEIPYGTHSLSNASLNSSWPKMEKGKNQLQQYIKYTDDIDPEKLFEIMENDERYPDSMLPNTGVGIELERVLSASFIKSEGYGTRSASVLAVDHHNHVTFHERTYNQGSLTDEQHFDFTLSNA